jgi:hypothetical protein
MYKYFEDMMYKEASNKEVKKRAPLNSEGNEGDEVWCYIEGDNSGLYHAKKHEGEWHYRLYSPEITGGAT